MQMTIIVDTEQDYQKWMLDQKTFAATLMGQTETKTDAVKNDERTIAEKN